eukprot:7968509-Pyramimonas_sp.AAC.1
MPRRVAMPGMKRAPVCGWSVSPLGMPVVAPLRSWPSLLAVELLPLLVGADAVAVARAPLHCDVDM